MEDKHLPSVSSQQMQESLQTFALRFSILETVTAFI